MNLPTNTKLDKTKSDNYDKINDRLNWLWKTSTDVYEFLTDEEKNNFINIFLEKLNNVDLINNYSVIRGKYMEYYLISSTNKFNEKIVKNIMLENSISLVKKGTKNNMKIIEFSFQQNYLKEKAHNIKPNQEKICNIYFSIFGGKEVYFIRFDRYSDANIFYDLFNGKYVLNNFSKNINLLRSGDSGSANEFFLCDDKSLKLVINKLIENGYEVGFKNYL